MAAPEPSRGKLDRHGRLVRSCLTLQPNHEGACFVKGQCCDHRPMIELVGRVGEMVGLLFGANLVRTAHTSLLLRCPSASCG